MPPLNPLQTEIAAAREAASLALESMAWLAAHQPGGVRTDFEKLIETVRASLKTITDVPGRPGSDYAGDIGSHNDPARSLAIVRDAYDWDVADDGTLCGLVAGDQGWASTHIRISAPDAAAARVKPLEWLPDGEKLTSQALHGRYQITPSRLIAPFKVSFPNGQTEYGATLVDAYALANADNDRTVRHALCTRPGAPA